MAPKAEKFTLRQEILKHIFQIIRICPQQL